MNKVVIMTVVVVLAVRLEVQSNELLKSHDFQDLRRIINQGIYGGFKVPNGRPPPIHTPFLSNP